MKYTTLSDDDMDVVQKFAFGGIANPVQRPYLRAADREFLNARQAELDAFEEQRQAYNTALQDWQTNVYQPYQQQVGAYNTGLEQYKAEVFNPYQQQVDAYNTAAQQYNTEVYNPYRAQYDAYERALNEYNAGPRTSDYAGPAAPTLARTFDMTAPVAPTPFGMTAPTAPKDFDLSAPVLPFNQEEVQARQQAAAQTARKDAGNRALAIDVVSDPNRFNFGSMSVANRFMAKGGEVMKDQELIFTPLGSSPQTDSAQMLAQMPAQPVRQFAAGGAANALTPEIARNLMQRSMTTGVPTSEFTRYGGYDAVRDLYNRGGGTYSLDGIDKDTLKSYATQVANTGVGNLSVLSMAGVPLTAAGIAAMRRNGIDEANIAQFSKQFGPLAIRPVSTTGALPLELATRMPGGLSQSNLSGASQTGVSGYTGPQPGDFRSILSATPIGWDGRPATSRPSDNVATPGTTAPQGGALTPSPVNLATNVPTFDYGSRGIGTAINQIAMPNMGPIGQARDYVSATNPNNYFAQTQPSTPGLTPGTTALAPIDMPLPGAINTLNTLGANSNLSPGMLGGQQNAGVMRDRLGNRIYAPGMAPLFGPPGFAKGGLADVNEFNMSDAEDEKYEPINTDPAGSAQKMLADLTGPTQSVTQVTESPNTKSIKRVSKKTSGGAGGTSKGMSMEYEALTSAKDLVPQLKDDGSARSQMEALALAYKLRAQQATDRSRGLMRNTLGAPTLEQPTLTKGRLTAKRFEKGGEAKKESAKEGEPGLFGVSDYATRASEQMFPGQMGQDDQRDAARHMLAAGIVARKYGPGTAEFLGKAHERLSNPESFFSMFGIGKPRDDYDMDVHNNRLGAELAARSKSQAELEKLVAAMAAQSQNKQVEGKPWTMSREQMEARKAKGMTPPPKYKKGGAVAKPKKKAVSS